jgi:hypothetical protein
MKFTLTRDDPYNATLVPSDRDFCDYSIKTGHMEKDTRVYRVHGDVVKDFEQVANIHRPRFSKDSISHKGKNWDVTVRAESVSSTFYM